MLQVKRILFRLGLFKIASLVRSGTWKHLRGGYSPRAFWNGWGGDFLRHGYQQRIFEGQTWLRDRLQAHPGASVLEIGCGFGRNLAYLGAEGARLGCLWGVDISFPLLLKARRELAANCALGRADILDLPFPDRAFDIVFTHGVLMHVPPASLARALSEIGRVAGREIFLVEEAPWTGSVGSRSVDLNGYTFLHDYPRALEAAGIAIVGKEMSRGEVPMVLFRASPRR